MPSIFSRAPPETLLQQHETTLAEIEVHGKRCALCWYRRRPSPSHYYPADVYNHDFLPFSRKDQSVRAAGEVLVHRWTLRRSPGNFFCGFLQKQQRQSYCAAQHWNLRKTPVNICSHISPLLQVVQNADSIVEVSRCHRSAFPFNHILLSPQSPCPLLARNGRHSRMPQRSKGRHFSKAAHWSSTSNSQHGCA